MTNRREDWKELDAHLEEHGCGTGDTDDPNYIGGLLHCPTAKALWDKLPPEEQISEA